MATIGGARGWKRGEERVSEEWESAMAASRARACVSVHACVQYMHEGSQALPSCETKAGGPCTKHVRRPQVEGQRRPRQACLADTRGRDKHVLCKDIPAKVYKRVDARTGSSCIQH
eukprot:363316-Chlamydomonas_euryale.AAC.7